MLEKAKNDKRLTDLELWWLMMGTWYAIYRLRQIELLPFNITVEQSTILVTLSYNGGSATSKALEDITLRQQNSISTLISRMEKNGLVTRVKHIGAKESIIMISDKGLDVLERITAISMKEVFSHMTASDKQELAEYLYALRVRVRNILGVSYQPPFVRVMLGKKVLNREDNEINNVGKTVSDYNLWVFINGAGFAIYRLRQLETTEFELTVEQSMILLMLQYSTNPITFKEIENFTLRQPSSISKLIRHMEHKGLILRRKQRGCRGYSVSITPEGKALSSKLSNVSIKMVYSILKHNERHQFEGHMATLNSKARDLLGILNHPHPLS